MPNCRAILDGVMPALKDARTALTCPRVNETVVNSAWRLFFDDDRSGSSGGFGLMLGGNLPRRLASSTDAVISWSNSVSVRYLTAVDRSLVGHAVARSYLLLSLRQRPATGKHLEPPRPRTGRVLMAESDDASWR